MERSYKMPENKGTLIKIKREIYNQKLTNNQRLFTGEYVGDFAVRYIAYQLHLKYEKALRRAEKRAKNKLLQNNKESIVLDKSDTH